MLNNANAVVFINSLSLTIAVIVLSSYWLLDTLELYISQAIALFTMIFIINKFAEIDTAYLTPLFIIFTLYIFFRFQKRTLKDSILYALLVMDSVTVFIYTISTIFQGIGFYTPNINHWKDIIIAALLIAFSITMRRYMERFKSIKLFKNKKTINQVILYLFAFFLLITIFYPRVTRLTDKTQLKLIGYALILSFMPLLLIFYKHMENLEKLNFQAENEILLNNSKYEEISRKENFVIKTLHYYKSFLKVLLYYSDRKDFENMGEFVENTLFPENKYIRDELRKHEDLPKKLEAIENEFIRSPIYETVLKALSIENVQVVFDINKPLIDLYMPDAELFKVLDIFLVNAINELQAIPLHHREQEQPYLQIAIKVEEARNTFTIINTLNKYESEGPKKGFGKGLTIAKEILDRYSFELYITPSMDTYDIKFITERSKRLWG